MIRRQYDERLNVRTDSSQRLEKPSDQVSCEDVMINDTGYWLAFEVKRLELIG